MKNLSIVALVLLVWACGLDVDSKAQEVIKKELLVSEVMEIKSNVDPEGINIKLRFPSPEGFYRSKKEQPSFANYLRSLPLHEDGAVVHYFNGQVKNNTYVHAAVVNMDVGERDLQQCADAIMRLRGEYLFREKDYTRLHFNFTNGFKADFDTWRRGNRIKVVGNQVSWSPSSASNASYKSFRRYMNMVFAYAGTLSLEKELVPISIDEIQIGDVFIQGGSPGHAVIVVDLVESEQSDEKLFLLAQSYMPAQEIHILKNPQNKNLSPWYSNKFNGRLATPEWIFKKEDLRRFKD